MSAWDGWPSCADCGDDVDALHEFAYMVRPILWADHGAGDGVLCVGCLEERLGRHLVPSDFWDVPLNRLAHVQSPRLRQRLGVT